MIKVPENRADSVAARLEIQEDELSRLYARMRPLKSESGTTTHPASGDEANTQTSSTHGLEEYAISDGWFWETDTDLRYRYISSGVKTVLGIDPEWYYGKTREELGCPDTVDPDIWRVHLESLTRHEPFTGFIFPSNGPDHVTWVQTSGTPVFSDEGEFLGYRGTARDVSAEIEARQHAEQLTNAIANIDEMFALWDADDRLIMCNNRYRELNAPIAEFVKPGVKYEELLGMALDAGLFPEALGCEQDWIANRLRNHSNPGEPFEMQRQDGRWILVHEKVLPDGAMISHSTDITARKRAELAFVEKNRMLMAAFRTMPDGVCIHDAEGNMVSWNDQLFEVMDVPAEAIISSPDPGKAFTKLLAERGDFDDGKIDGLIAGRRNALSSERSMDQEHKLQTGKWVECRGNRIEGGGYIAIYRDITERKQARERLQYLASVDALTGIHNRRSFLEIAEAEFLRAERYGRPLSFLLIDVDHFKSINDRFGHTTGDTVLRKVVAACQEVLRDSDEMGRIGGEEFAILLPDTGHASACIAAERFRWAVEKVMILTDDEEANVTVSIGIATATRKHASTEDLMADADTALYQAKRTGRNKSVHLEAA